MAKLQVNLIPWLLEPDYPSVRYFTLTELYQLPKSNTDVLETKELIMSNGIIPRILKKQTPQGIWYNPKTVKKYGNSFYYYSPPTLP